MVAALVPDKALVSEFGERLSEGDAAWSTRSST
jgi:hypothetical protein